MASYIHEYLQFCNALGRHNPFGPWLPMRVSDDGTKFQDPAGLNIVPPMDWKPATLGDIDGYMVREGLELITMAK